MVKAVVRRMVATAAVLWLGVVSLTALGASSFSTATVDPKTGAVSASFSATSASRGVVVAWDAADKGGSLAGWTHCAYLGTAAKGATSFAATLPSAARVGKVYRVFLVTNGATAASYVQAGLVLHYDAQENGGVGTHVGSMGGKWVNLVKPGTDDFKTSALTAGSDANGSFVTIASPSSDPSITFAGGDVLPQTGDKMVEVVSRYAGAASDVTTSFLPIFTVAGDGRLGYQSNKGRIVAAFADVTEDNATAPTKGDYASIVNGDYAYRYCTHYSKYQADSEFTEWRSWSVAFDRLGEYSTLHRNDETLLKPTSDAWKRWQSLTYKMDKTYDADGTCFNCEKRSHSATFALGAKGKTVAYRSVRVYKGRLTDAQRTHNYKVDRLRYFGASLADVLTDESPAEDVLAFAASESASEAKTVTALAPTCVEPAAGETVQILTDRQKEFFQLPLEERRALKGKSDYRWSLTYGPLPWYARTWEESRRPDGTWPRFVPFTWKGTGPFDVRIVRAKDGKVFYEQKGVMANSAEVVNFEADCTYVWSVSNAVGGAQGRFKTEGGYPRLLWDHDPEGHVYNLRDIGGLTVSNGLYKVRQNLIFRSTRLTKDLMDKTGYGNGTGDSVLVQEKYGNRSFWHSTEHDGIGIRHEIDLRGTGQAGTYMRDTLRHSVIGDDVSYKLYNGLSYGSVVGDSTHWKLAHDQLLDIFDKVHNGKPVTIHCQGGKDRTGILCFLMEAIFGESDLEKNQDWEASWFWYAPSGHSIDELFEQLEASSLKGATINEKVMSLLTDPKKVNISQAQIAQFRADMLEPVGEEPVGPTPVDPPEEPEDPEDDPQPVDPTEYGSADSTAVTYTWKAGVSGPWTYTTNWTPSKTSCYGIPNSANYATAALPGELPAGTEITLANKTINLKQFSVANANALTLTFDNGRIVMADYGKTGAENPVSFGATGPATLVFKGANPQLRGQSEGSHGRFYFGENSATTLRFVLPATAWTAETVPIRAAEDANAYFYSKTAFEVDAQAVGTLAAGVAVTNVIVSVGDGGAVKTDGGSTSQLAPLLAKATFDNLPSTMTGSLVVSADKRCILCIVSGKSSDEPPLGPTVAPSLLSPNGTAMVTAIHTDAQNTFLSKSMDERRAYAMTAAGREAMRTEVTGRWPNAEQPDNQYAKKTSGTFPQWVTLTWTGDGPFTVEVFRKADDKLFFTCENLQANSVDVFNCELDTEYVWRVSNAAGISETATFKTDNVFPRLLWDHDDLGQIYGVRDLGGAKGRHGLVVKQGLIIRSSEPMKGTTSYATDAAFWTGTALDGLGIRYELDLRSAEQTGYATASGFGDGVIYNNNEINSYQDIFEADKTAAFKAALDVALNPENYPLNFHCQIGKDRTGSLALVLEALLGMSKDDIMRDYESSWFWYKPNDNPMDEAYNQIDRLLACVENFEGSTFNAKVASYCFSIGVKQEQLDVFRTAMLGEGGAAPTEDDASVARGEVDPEDYGDPDTKAVTYTWKPGVSGAWECTTNWTPSVAVCYGIPDNADYATAVLPSDLPAGTVVTVADETISLRRFNVLNANALTLVLDNGRIVVSEGTSKADNPVEIGKTGPATVEFRGERPQLEAQSAGSDGRVYFGENYATTLRFALPATAWTHATAPIRMSNEGANVYFYANTSFEVDVGAAALPELGEAVTNVLVSVYDDPEYPGGIRPFDDDLNLVLKTQTAFTGLPADVEGRLEKVDAAILCILSREVPPAETSVSVASVAQDGTVTLAIDALRSDAYLTVGYGSLASGAVTDESCLCVDRGGWQDIRLVGKVAAGTTQYVFTLPDGWGRGYTSFRVFLTPLEATPLEYYATATATDGTSYVDTGVVPTPTTLFDVIFESTTLTKDQMKGKTVFEATSDELPSNYFHYRMFVNASGYPAFDWGDTANGTVIKSEAVKQTPKDDTGIRWQFVSSSGALSARYRYGDDYRWTKAVSGTPTQAAAGSVRVYGLGSISRIDASDAETIRWMVPAKGFDASGNEVFGFFDSQSHQMYPFHGTFALGEVVPFRNDQFDGSPYVAESETFTYVVPTAAAEIGGKSYATVAEAMAAAKPGETVKLVADPETAVIELKGGVDVDLDAFDATKVTFKVPAGVDWFDVPTGPKHDAVYALTLNDKAKPVIANGGGKDGIEVTDAKVRIHITNEKDGLYYALFASETLDAPAEKWAKVVDYAQGLTDFEVDKTAAPGRFYKVVAGDRP